MYTHYQLKPVFRGPSLVLNYNVIAEDCKSEIIKGMGMAACQIKCLRCRHCSACGCGHRS